MRILRHLLRESRATVALAGAASLLNGAASAALVAVVNELLTQAAAPRSGLLGAAFVALLILVLASGVVAQVLLIRLAASVAYRLRLGLARQILSLPLPRLEELGVSRLYAVLTQDVTAVSNAWIALPVLSFHVAILLGGLAYLAWLSWPLLLVVLLCFALGIGLYQAMSRKAQALLRSFRERQDALFASFETLLRGTKELKLDGMRRRHFLERSLEGTASALREDQIAAFRAWAIGNNWASALTFAVVGFLLFFGVRIVPVEQGAAVGFVIAILFLRAHIGGVLNVVPALVQGNVAIGKIESLGLGLPGEPPPDPLADSGVALPSPQAWRSIELAGVVFHYEGGGEFRLGPIDLTVRAGELLFVTGGNGSGKSTFAKVLTGLYAPTAGTIRIDGRALDARDADGHRALFTAVFSDFFVFDELLSPDGRAVDAWARDHLERFGLAGKVSVDAGALSTTALSLGERKRLALIAAYLQDRPVLVLDEWAADQDPRFKDVFYHEILAELVARGKTVVVISHDDRYFHLAHRLLKFEDGRVEVSVPEHAPRDQGRAAAVSREPAR